MNFMKAKKLCLTAEHLKQIGKQRVVIRPTFDNGEPYVGLGRVSLEAGLFELHFEWIVRLQSSKDGSDAFDSRHSIAILDSFKDEHYDMECELPELVIHNDDGWLTVDGVGMTVRVSTEPKHIAYAQELKENVENIKGPR